MKSFRTTLGVILGIAFIVFVFTSGHTPFKTESDTTPLFTFEIARTPRALQTGLSGRADIPPNYGMLFVFSSVGSYGFWMKDMLVSIDIIWLDTNGEILGIEESVSPDTYPQLLHPPRPVRYVLETRAGEAVSQGWQVGDTIELPE